MAYDALREGRPNYKLRLKWHIFQHLLCELDKGMLINPRIFSCWLDESYVGHMARIARGVHPTHVGCRVLQRWLIGLLCWLHDGSIRDL